MPLYADARTSRSEFSSICTVSSSLMLHAAGPVCLCMPSREWTRHQEKHDAAGLPGQLPAGAAHLQPRTVRPLKPAQALAAQSGPPPPCCTAACS